MLVNAGSAAHCPAFFFWDYIIAIGILICYTEFMNDKEKKITNERPISLAGVDFKKLLSAFLKVKPDESKKQKVEEAKKD